MDATDTYEAGRKNLEQAWLAANSGAVPDLPDEVRSDIAAVMTHNAQVAQRYALPGQLLLKLTVGNENARVLKDFPVDGPFSARTFAKETLTKTTEVGDRLGASPDAYVSNPLRRSILEESLLTGKGGNTWKPLFAVLAYVDANPAHTEAALVETLRRISTWDKTAPPKKTSATPAPKQQDVVSLADQAGIEQDLLLDLVDVLESDQPQIILAGPPGTSKTHVALALARYLTGDDPKRFKVLQFHSSYGYEDFIEGLRPMVDDGTLYFDIAPGAVRRIAQDVLANERSVLVLDEMNRANLPRVLGELLYAFERRGEPVDLLYTEGFKLPPEVCFIGTMNTADRSIRSIDAAVRRRFEVFEMPPRSSTIEQFYESVANEVDGLPNGLDDLNTALTALLDRHHTIGHTFFMDNRGMTSARLRQIWERQVRPLIEEYLFDQPDLLAEFTLERFWPAAAE